MRIIYNIIFDFFFNTVIKVWVVSYSYFNNSTIVKNFAGVIILFLLPFEGKAGIAIPTLPSELINN